MKWKIDNLADLEKVAVAVLELAKSRGTEGGATVLALHGNLGAGKTTFTKHLAKVLGVTENVNSPTFVIQKYFEVHVDDFFKKMIHIDTYRIDLQDELVKLGWAENVAEKNNLIAVEWPENIPDLLPKNTIHLYFIHINETTREIEIK